jgi:hypothetical protein
MRMFLLNLPMSCVEIVSQDFVVHCGLNLHTSYHTIISNSKLMYWEISGGHSVEFYMVFLKINEVFLKYYIIIYHVVNSIF